MPFQVHQEPLYKRYYASWFSTASIYSVFFVFVLIILPLIIAYNSYDFWLKEDTYWEQPDVAYKYLGLFQWHGYDSNGKANTWGYSTNAQANTLIANLRSPQVRTAEFDDNRDGKVDRLELSVLLPLNAGDRIHGFETILYHDVRLSQRAKVLFDAISYANYESGTGMESLEIDGELSLNQRWPFNVYGGYRRWYEDDKLFDISTTTSAQDIQMDRLLKRSNARNVTLAFAPSSAYVSRRAAAQALDDATQTYFNASVTYRIPSQFIIYTPTTSQVLKFAWIQYISFFLVVAFVLFSLNSFIYRHQLLPTYVVTDVIHQKIN